MTFQFDAEKTLDAFAHSSTVDLLSGNATLYAVVCIGSGEAPHYSHGGVLTLDAEFALKTAREANIEEQGPGGNGCRYLPAAVGINPGDIMTLGQAIFGSDGIQEPGSDELG